jgi:hypothetical protein
VSVGFSCATGLKDKCGQNAHLAKRLFFVQSRVGSVEPLARPRKCSPNIQSCDIQSCDFSNSATITVAAAPCWRRLRPGARLQLISRPAVRERRVSPSVRRAVARLSLIQGLRECSSRCRTPPFVHFHFARHRLTEHSPVSGSGVRQTKTRDWTDS